MPVLTVANGFSGQLPGLGKITPLGALSEKRITKAVRQSLRDQYGFPAVEVSCDADMPDGVWHGTCRIDGAHFRYAQEFVHLKHLHILYVKSLFINSKYKTW